MENIKFTWLVVLRAILIGVVYCHITHKRSSISHLEHNAPSDSVRSVRKFTPSSSRGYVYKDICTKPDAICVPHVRCPAHVRIKSNATCRIIGGRSGVCCTTGQNHTEFHNERTRGNHMVLLDASSIGSVYRHSKSEIAELHNREIKLLQAGKTTILFPGSASYGHFRNSRTFNMADLTKVTNVANKALEIAIATRAFKDRQGITPEQLEYEMVEQDLRPTPLGQSCINKPFCSLVPEKYRRIDGACNNIFNPSWGTPLSPYARLLPPSYHDGIWTPRRSAVSGKPLNSPRLISTTIIPDNDVKNEDFTLILMQFGQLLSHEITQSIDTSFSNGSAISCCTQDGSAELLAQFRHPACMPIEIPRNDPFFSDYKQRCMNFVRSVLAPRQDCTLGYAQQMNKVTHFIDGSMVYGSTPEQTGELRSFEGGRLKVFNDYGRDLLPLTADSDACLTMEQGSACFTSGDTRTNQMISLVALHLIFMREHNRLADELSALNPYWDDEEIFLEARQILIAELQVIVYKEFVPAVIGDVAMEEFQLRLYEGSEYSFDYDQRIEPSVTNEFAVAALRFGHSMVDGLLKVYGPNRMEEVIAIPEVMFHPARMRKRTFLDEILSTLTTEPIQEVDNSLSDALTKYMFRAGNPFGVDLASINIQRGRDHGLRPYNDYRELTGLPRIRSFQEFGPEMGERLRAVYASVDDIDLWVGGLLEEKAPGSIVGPTFRDIIADQFVRLKEGDKYFFQNDPSINPGHFTPEQLQELRMATLSRLICDNSDGILLARQAPNAFRKPNVPGNEVTDCEGPIIPRVNLMLWQERSFIS